LIPGGGGGTAAEADVDSNEDEDEEEAVAVAVAAGAAPPTPPLPELLLLLALALVPAGLGSLGAFACRGFDHAFMGAAFMVEAARQVQERSEGTVRGLLNERIALLLSTGNRPAIEGEEVEEASGDREPMPLCEKVSSLSTAYLTVAKMEGWRNGDHATCRSFFPGRRGRRVFLGASLFLSLSARIWDAASSKQQATKQRLLNPTNGGGRAPHLHTLPALYVVRRLSCEDPAAAIEEGKGGFVASTIRRCTFLETSAVAFGLPAAEK
jgi:hypothetical protein